MGIIAVYIFTSIDLYIFGWFVTLIYVIFDQFEYRNAQFVIFMALFGSPSFSVFVDIAMPSLSQDPRQLFRDQIP